MKVEGKFVRERFIEVFNKMDALMKSMFKMTIDSVSLSSMSEEELTVVKESFDLMDESKLAYLELADAIDQQTAMLLEIRETLEKIQKTKD